MYIPECDAAQCDLLSIRKHSAECLLPLFHEQRIPVFQCPVCSGADKQNTILPDHIIGIKKPGLMRNVAVVVICMDRTPRVHYEGEHFLKGICRKPRTLPCLLRKLTDQLSPESGIKYMRDLLQHMQNIPRKECAYLPFLSGSSLLPDKISDHGEHFDAAGCCAHPCGGILRSCSFREAGSYSPPHFPHGFRLADGIHAGKHGLQSRIGPVLSTCLLPGILQNGSVFL